MSDLPLNLGYIKTKPGMFKGITAAVGLLALAFTAAAFDKATYYNYKCTSFYEKYFQAGKGQWGGKKPDIDKDTGEVGSYVRQIASWNRANSKNTKDIKIPVAASCEELFGKANYEKCSHSRKVIKSFKEAGFSVKDLPGDPCPIKYMVTLPMVIIIMAWLASLIMLVVMLVMDLDQKSPGFLKIDAICHIIGGGFLGFSTLVMAGFLIWSFLSDYPCTQKRYDKLYEYNLKDYQKHGGVKPVRESCLEESDDVYKIWLLAFGTLCSGATAVMYIMTAMMLKKSVGGVAPMMMVTPSGQQQPPPLLTPSQAEAPNPGEPEVVQPKASIEAHHHHHRSKKSLKQ